MANMLKLLHPFIPFFTESVWEKNSCERILKGHLVSSTWPIFKVSKIFKKNQNNINNLIEIITNIRSTKAELKITPKLYCDLFFPKKSTKLKTLISNNLNLIKQVGRVNQILDLKTKKNMIDILVFKEKYH